MSSEATPRGRLLLVPNTLDLGSEAEDIRQLLPDGVLATAARLTRWVVEDARSARAFLKRVAEHHALGLPLQEVQIEPLPRPRKGSREAVPAAAWQALLKPALEGRDIGLLSEAGLPAVADPGAALVAAAHDCAIAVVPLAGASSLMLALAASGLNGQSFAFVGYLPQDAAARTARVIELERLSRRWQQTQIVIETPYRNAALLDGLLAALAAESWLSVSVGLSLAGGFTRCARVAAWRAAPAALPTDRPAVFSFLAS